MVLWKGGFKVENQWVDSVTWNILYIKNFETPDNPFAGAISAFVRSIHRCRKVDWCVRFLVGRKPESPPRSFYWHQWTDPRAMRRLLSGVQRVNKTGLSLIWLWSIRSWPYSPNLDGHVVKSLLASPKTNRFFSIWVRISERVCSIELTLSQPALLRECRDFWMFPFTWWAGDTTGYKPSSLGLKKGCVHYESDSFHE